MRLWHRQLPGGRDYVVCADASFMTKEERFCIAYWDWKRGLRVTEPNPVNYGLDPWAGEILARQCHAEFEKRKINQILSSLPAA